ncbi:MAG: hypothetical protein GOV02_01875 [Candidatus Aenigmarchaeota archaeon]|nr:hypothetical protein [Candidatus Aenigmarchaeota archaeon]
MVVNNPAVLRPIVIRRLRSEGYSAELISDEIIDHAALTYFNEEVANPTGVNIPSPDVVVDNICKTFYRELSRIVSANQ